MPNIFTNPFFWVAMFATVVLAVAVGFLLLVFRYAANRNQPQTLVAQGPVAPQNTSPLQKMAKVIFNWKTIIAVGLVVLGAYLVSNYLSIMPDWQTIASTVTGGFNWTVDFVASYGIWTLVAVPLYLAWVGYNQNKKYRSYTGDVLYYVLGGAAVIGGIGLVVLGKDLLFRAVAQSRGKTRATFECWYMETTSVDCDAVSQIAAPTIDWGVIVLCLFGVAFLGGLWKMKVIQQTTALGATVIVLPFMLWLAWGALPSDFREDVLEIAPFVQSEAEVTRELNLSIAALANAEARRAAEQRQLEADRREANEVKIVNRCEGREYSSMQYCVTFTLPPNTSEAYILQGTEAECIFNHPFYMAGTPEKDAAGNTIGFRFTNTTGFTREFKVYQVGNNQYSPSDVNKTQPCRV